MNTDPTEALLYLKRTTKQYVIYQNDKNGMILYVLKANLPSPPPGLLAILIDAQASAP